MTDGAQITAATAAAEPAVNMVNLLRALGNPVRWEVLRLLATEGSQSVNDLAARVDRAQHSMSKHMQILREVGAVVMVADANGDGRKLFHALPPGCLRDGANGKELDYGACVLRFA